MTEPGGEKMLWCFFSAPLDLQKKKKKTYAPVNGEGGGGLPAKFFVTVLNFVSAQSRICSLCSIGAGTPFVAALEKKKIKSSKCNIRFNLRFNFFGLARYFVQRTCLR